jgi:putative membrane protein insertion efficiency factor
MYKRIREGGFPMKGIILLFILFYQKIISPIKPRTCRYYPSCSQYAFQAIEKFGLKKGIYYGIKRVLRCHPFHEGGYDPIPED